MLGVRGRLASVAYQFNYRFLSATAILVPAPAATPRAHALPPLSRLEVTPLTPRPPLPNVPPSAEGRLLPSSQAHPPLPNVSARSARLDPRCASVFCFFFFRSHESLPEFHCFAGHKQGARGLCWLLRVDHRARPRRRGKVTNALKFVLRQTSRTSKRLG
jgi:hypothetical protein